jgi:hypothetical protein
MCCGGLLWDEVYQRLYDCGTRVNLHVDDVGIVGWVYLRRSGRDWEERTSRRQDNDCVICAL